jgi:hypothetical protein
LTPAEYPANWNDTDLFSHGSVTKFKHTYPGENCVIGGGVYVNESMVCSTYWYPDPSAPLGVTNITERIEGSDGDFFVDKMKSFVGASVAESKKWLAVLMLHYIHLPHPAMPTCEC